MNTENITIRDENVADVAVIHHIEQVAFGRDAEADLVDNLREEGLLILSLVAVKGKEIVGHIGFSRAKSNKDNVVLLAPIAVLPKHQKNGVGSALIREGISRLKSSGEDAVFVVGDPNYYEKFGFQPASVAGFSSNYDAAAFQVLFLNANSRNLSGYLKVSDVFRLVD